MSCCFINLLYHPRPSNGRMHCMCQKCKARTNWICRPKSIRIYVRMVFSFVSVSISSAKSLTIRFASDCRHSHLMHYMANMSTDTVALAATKNWHYTWIYGRVDAIKSENRPTIGDAFDERSRKSI